MTRSSSNRVLEETPEGRRSQEQCPKIRRERERVQFLSATQRVDALARNIIGQMRLPSCPKKLEIDSTTNKRFFNWILKKHDVGKNTCLTVLCRLPARVSRLWWSQLPATCGTVSNRSPLFRPRCGKGKAPKYFVNLGSDTGMHE